MPGTAGAQVQSGDLFTSVNLGGSGHDGGCSIYQYRPSGPPPSTFGSFGCNFASNCGLAAPRGLAFDNHSPPSLFVATENFDGTNFQGRILKVASDGTPSTFTSAFPPNFFLQELAIDGAGNVFVSGADIVTAPYAEAIYEVSPDGNIVGGVPFFASSPSYPMHSDNNAVGLALDSAGNLFVGANAEQTVYKFISTGGVLSNTPTIFAGPGAFQSGEGPGGLTFDASGNLFVATQTFTEQNNNQILKFTPDYNPSMGTGSVTTFATGLTNAPKGLAFDSAGNLFLAETGDPSSGDILEFTPGGPVAVPGITPAPGWGVAYFDPPGDFPPIGNRGPEWLTFPPNTLVSQNSVVVDIGTVGSANTDIALTFPNVTAGGTTMATPIDPITAGPLPAGYTALGTDANNLSQAFELTTTATTGTPITIAFQVPLPPGPDVSQLSVFHNEGGTLVNATCPTPRPGPTPDETTNTIFASVTSFSPFVIAKRCQIGTSSSSNFNGTAITSGRYIWFSSVLTPTGLGSDPVTIHFTQQTISSAHFTLSVPDASVTFDPHATSATTSFSNGTWVTRVPSSGLAGNTFLSAFGYMVPANLPGGIRNVTWSGMMNPDTPGVSMQWKWAAAVYNGFSSNYNAVGVKPVDDNRASQYKNSDHAGTPENFKSHVIGGATGGGGSNYTGAYSGTVAVGPCP